MSNLAIIGYEIRRLVFTRKYLYLLLLVSIFAYDILSRLTAHGAYGAPPYAQISYAKFLGYINPVLFLALALLCVQTYSERELAARRILFSAPMTPTGYLTFKGLAIAAAFLLIALIPILLSFGYLAWQFRFFRFGDFFHPILVFHCSTALFVFGSAMLLGRFSGKLIYGLVAVLLFMGIFNLGLPIWLDVMSNGFLAEYPKILVRLTLSSDIVYRIPTDFLLSRLLLACVGTIFFVLACWKRWR